MFGFSNIIVFVFVLILLVIALFIICDEISKIHKKLQSLENRIDKLESDISNLTDKDK